MRCLVALAVITLPAIGSTSSLQDPNRTITAASVEQAEQFLRDQGFRVFRVRHHDKIARIEVMPEDIPQLVQEPLRSDLVARFKALGYSYVTLDLAGFRSGSMNVDLQT